MKTTVILNPASGRGGAKKQLPRIEQILKASSLNFNLLLSERPWHAAELAEAAARQGADVVVSAGGDGTLNEVVNGLMQVDTKKRPALGVVPIGSGNDFAFANNIPTSANQAMALALNGEASPIDLALMTGENGMQAYIDNTLGIGFDAIVTIRSHRLPIIRGFLMYLVAVIQTIFLNAGAIHVEVDFDGKKWEQDSFMVVLANGPREGGGFHMTPAARSDDGILNYLVAGKVSRAMMFRLLPEFMKGTQERFEQITLGEFKKFSLKSDSPLYIHIDGEIYTSFGSDLRGLSVEILPKALNVVRPAKE